MYNKNVIQRIKISMNNKNTVKRGYRGTLVVTKFLSLSALGSQKQSRLLEYYKHQAASNVYYMYMLKLIDERIAQSACECFTNTLLNTYVRLLQMVVC